MKPSEIEELAIGRIASALIGAHQAETHGCPGDESCHVVVRLRGMACTAVKGLGDLLPIATQTMEVEDGYAGQSVSDTGVVTAFGRPCTRMRRYVTGWGKADA